MLEIKFDPPEQDVVRTIGMDPGSKNFGWSVTDHWIDDHWIDDKPRMVSETVASGMFLEPLSDLKAKDLTKAAEPYKDAFYGLAYGYQPNAVMIERFMASGLRVGTTIEVANIMAGVTITVCQDAGLEMYMTPAVTWKGYFNRAFGYKEALKDVYRSCAATPHQVDASLLGVFCASTLLDCEPFESISEEEDLIFFLASLQDTSETRLRRIRG